MMRISKNKRISYTPESSESGLRMSALRQACFDLLRNAFDS